MHPKYHEIRLFDTATLDDAERPRFVTVVGLILTEPLKAVKLLVPVAAVILAVLDPRGWWLYVLPALASMAVVVFLVRAANRQGRRRANV